MINIPEYFAWLIHIMHLAYLYKFFDSYRIEGKYHGIAYFQQQTKDIRLFLSQMNGIAVLAEINANCASVEQFMKRFFDNFNAFRVLKYLNFVHESCYSKIDILSAANKLLAELNLPVAESLECALQIFRKLFR